MANSKKDLLKEEVAKHMRLVEYSFYVGEDAVKGYDDNMLVDEAEGDEPENASKDIDSTDDEVSSPEINPAAPEETPSEIPADASAAPEAQAAAPLAPEAPVAPAGDEVELDITQLVKGTEEAKASADLVNTKMSDLMAKFDQLLQKVSSMDAISSKIDNLEHEIEVRNPTDNEKLDMRSLTSFPYNLKLTDYWAEKEGQYDVMGNEDEEKEYVLTTDDIQQDFNPSDIKNSFGVSNDYEEEEF